MQEEHERKRQAHKERMIDLVYAPLHNKTVAETFGGGEYGKQQAILLHRIKHDLPLDGYLNQQPTPAGTAE